MVSALTVVKSEGPGLVPFFKTTCIYFVLWLPSGSWASAVVKVLPILCLSAFVAARGTAYRPSAKYSRRVLAGLVFSAAGDAFLVWQDDGFFEHGLVMFAIAHVFYIAAFGLTPPALRIAVIGLFFFLIGMVVILPSIPSSELAIAVAIYSLLLVLMAWRAIVLAILEAGPTGIPWPRLCAVMGAILFLLSDLSLAVNRFVVMLPHSRALIMISYYGAQLCIALSARGGERRLIKEQ
uniref:lysoplasmalogenase n=1 Tax=Eptatretus burgeri TaxID=7764 RepID=A0A8C4QL25_EPTBU